MRRKMIRSAAVLVSSAMITVSLGGCSLTSITPNAAPEAVQESSASTAESGTASDTDTAVQSADGSESSVSSALQSDSSLTATESVVSTVEEVIPAIAAEEITPTPTPTPLPDSELKVMGEEAEGEYAYKVRLENGSDQDVIGIAVRLRSDGYDTASYLSEEEPFVPGERQILYYDGTKAMEEALETGDICEFQITVTYADGLSYRIGNFPFGDTDDVKIMRGSDYAYLIYDSTEQSGEVNTENTEREKLGYAAVEEASEESTEGENSGETFEGGDNDADYREQSSDDASGTVEEDNSGDQETAGEEDASQNGGDTAAGDGSADEFDKEAEGFEGSD